MGGTHSYEIDRQAALDVQKALPDIKPLVLENRVFLRKAVRWLAKNGVTQFIDVGSGLPTAGSTHETALKVNSNARVLYVDLEQTAVVEGNEVIKRTGCERSAGMIQANALEPSFILSHPQTKRLIDFTKPVAVIMLALIHFFEPAQYVPLLTYWKQNIPKGSAFVMSHCTSDNRTEEACKQTKAVYERAKMPLFIRVREEIEPVMEGWKVVDPGEGKTGLVKASEWKKEEGLGEESPETGIWWVGVGLLE